MALAVKVSTWIATAAGALAAIIAAATWSGERAGDAMEHEGRHVQVEADVQRLEETTSEYYRVIAAQLEAGLQFNIMIYTKLLEE